MVAPVCHDSRDQVITQPNKKLPAIPVASDLKSALAAIAALKLIVENLVQNIPQNNTGSGGQAQPAGSMIQSSRTTEKVKVTNPSDPSQFVEIERINGLTMTNKKSGEQWVWKR